MKNYYILCASLIASYLLTACGNGNEALSPEVANEALYEEVTNNMEADFLGMMEREDPVWAGVSQSNSFGRIDTDFFIEIENTEDLAFLVEKLVEGSVREPGIVDMMEPYYGLRIEYEDGYTEDFHLWITDDQSTGTIMDSRDTHYIYTFSEEVSEQFLSLLPEEFILEEPAYADWVEEDSFGISEFLYPFLEQDINTLLDYNDIIVRGSYVSAEPSEVPDTWGDESMFYYTFEVDEVLRGDVNEDTIEVGQATYHMIWVQDPDSRDTLDTLYLDDPFVALPDPDKEVLLFLSEGMEDDTEFWRFSEPTMVEILEDGTLQSVSQAFDPELDLSDRVETVELPDGQEVEITREIADDELPAEDPFENMTIEDLMNLMD